MAVSAVAISAVVGAGVSVYSATQKPKIPGAKMPAEIAPDTGPEVDKSAIDKQRKRRQAAATGRQDTLLTGPLGLTGEPASSSKTLLGS
jgi:hypothetical protein